MTPYFEILIGLSVIVYLFYHYLTRNFDYWKKQNVTGPKPIPYFGTFKDVAFHKIHSADFIKLIYDAHCSEPAVGLFQGSKPVLLLIDPEMIKDVLIRHFTAFPNRGGKINFDIDPLAEQLLHLHYERWKPMRKKLSPTFTSGKIKEMFYLINECAQHFVEYMERLVSKNEIVECRKLAAKYTIDVIGVCAFGLHTNSLNDSDSDFLKYGLAQFANNWSNLVRRTVRSLPGWAAKPFKPFARNDEVINFFVNTITNAIEHRKKINIRRNDFVDLLRDLKDNPDQIEGESMDVYTIVFVMLFILSHVAEMTDIILTAQAFAFFLAGFETSSSTISHVMYELAFNHHIQNKLRAEIQAVASANDDQLSFEIVNAMTYLDKVVKETLRKYTPGLSLIRVAVRDHTFGSSKISVSKGTTVIIPVDAIHHDPRIYPNPEKFDPERFIETNENSRPQMSYLPFSDGPRNCIGERFGLIQTKLGIIAMVKHFRIDVCEKTFKVYKKANTVLLSPLDGIYLKIKSSTMEFSLYEIVSGVAMTLYLVRCWLTKTFDYWRKRNVVGPRPLPIFGTFKDVALNRIHAVDYVNSIYNAYPGETSVGLFYRSIPVLLMKDPNMIKDALIKNFLTFPNRGLKIYEDIEPLAQHLIFLDYKRWKPLRRKLAPAFTSKKVEEIFYLVDDCAQQLIDYIDILVAKEESIDCRELAAKFIIDVIGVHAFGFDMNTMDDKVGQFRKIVRELFADSWKNKLRLLNRRLPYWVAATLKPIFRNEKIINFFVDTVKSTMDYRKANNLKRNDFIDHLMNLKDRPDQSGSGNVSDILLTAQAFAFFVAGFESSYITISNAMYELALNTDIQEKLRQEVNIAYNKDNGKLNYETVKNMKYLDQVFQETLRKYPPVFGLLREAVDDHMFEESRIMITKGTKIFIPIYAIHHDPNIYPEPEKFDPKRFDEELVKSRPQMTFLPFGDGPRNCIGEQFAHNQIKLGLAATIKHYTLDVCDKTCNQYVKRPRFFLIVPKNGLFLKIKRL
ncbi:uncharacterized protein LOC131673753 [Phymastichus coffea]|uniref:uncharacterized protein LOC131673753 n=1 Tax=Phymastichus coffea TaxID=108790 RepID=UPI00273AFC33|nr:uncharacterized protein LOC131673753 [Phymastichus coffea]